MKRLLRKAESARMVDLHLDDSIALAAIKGKDLSFDSSKLFEDKGPGKKAFWGAISDDLTYLVESYIYQANSTTKKCAFIAAPIINNNGIYSLSNNYEIVIKEIQSNTEARSIPKEGIVLSSGNKVVCTYENNSVDVAEENLNK